MAGLFGATRQMNSAEKTEIASRLSPRGGAAPVWRDSESGTVCVRSHAAGGGGLFVQARTGRCLAWDGYFMDSADRVHSLEDAAGAADRFLERWEARGFNALATVHGSYALAIIEEHAGSITLVRDPAGSRPLYWASANHTLVFASTTKSLFASKIISPSINPAAVVSYVSMVAVPDPMSIYAGVNMVPAGAVMKWTDPVTAPVVTWHWTTPQQDDAGSAPAVDKWRDRVRAALELAVDVHGRGAVVPGYLLSGGHDTTGVVGLAAKLPSHAGRPPSTLTIGFSGRSPEFNRFNELAYAEEAARFIGTDHHQALIDEQSVSDVLPALVWHMDQPSGDAINSYLVSGAAREMFKSVLTGTGGDELFIGSHWYLQLFRLNRMERWWKLVPPAVRAALCALPLPARYQRRLARIDDVSKSTCRKYAHLKFVVKPDEQRALFTPGLLQANPQPTDIIAEYLARAGGGNGLQQIMLLFMMHEVTNLQLRDLDVMAYAHGLEARSPLVDRSVMDCMFSVPPQLLAPEGRLRYLMNLALDDILPPVTKTRKKMSFIVPMEIWARGSLRIPIMELLSRESVEKRGHFRWPAVAAMLSDFFETGKERHPFKIWNIALLELWERIHLDLRIDDPTTVTLKDLL